MSITQQAGKFVVWSNNQFTFEEESFLEELDFRFWVFHFSENASKLNGPPKDERLIVAAFAANGLNMDGAGWGSTMLECTNDLPERGTTPSLPWKSLNAMSKLGPSSKIGPLPPRPWSSKVESSIRKWLNFNQAAVSANRRCK